MHWHLYIIRYREPIFALGVMRQKLVQSKHSASHNEEKQRDAGQTDLTPRKHSAPHNNEEKYRESLGWPLLFIGEQATPCCSAWRDAPGLSATLLATAIPFRASVRSRSAIGTSIILYPQIHFLKRYITFNRKVYKFQIKGIYLLDGRYMPMESRFARNVYRVCDPVPTAPLPLNSGITADEQCT